MTQRYRLFSATRLQNEDGIINLSGKKEYYACRYKIDPDKKRRLNKLCFATRLAIVKAFPGFVHIGPPLFFGGVVNIRCLHGFFK